MLDETLLDDPAALRQHDRDATLLSLAVAGARLRTAVRLAAEPGGITELKPEGHPQHLLLAGQGPAAAAADTLAALLAATGARRPATVLRPTALAAPDAADTAPLPGARWSLPGWAGPADLVVVLTASATEAGLAELARAAYRRGCALAVVAPQGGPLAETATAVHAPLVPYAPPTSAEAAAAPAPAPLLTPAGPAERPVPQSPATFWGILAPLLLLVDRLGLVHAGPAELESVADHLDTVAGRCGPEAALYLNPAKTLAARLDETLPLLWADGPLARAAADRFAALLADHAGLAAVPATLPEALATHRGLLGVDLTAAKDGDHGDPADSADYLFRDRVEEPDRLRPHVVLLGATDPGESPLLTLARRYVQDHNVDLSEPDTNADPDAAATPAPPPEAAAPTAPAAPAAPDDHAAPLRDFAGLLATLDFTAAYLRLAAIA
ncbi:hypothetical protein BIV57_13655 [Mangrovactinospora gilvigrisea]|uniref:SIS domain-containing protein n=1 Tax=Mangrovactinospora gilvigrisea TaxID=1428644 RepID=A0A1J7BE83_9ACTN|nr:SIS domain-containing protein [Mangrovactinospora gilvigrisea]OIV36942.1 hypothetical protein BIV57_13655 [Mangrovactinospora gilvigrisea]